MFNPFDFVLGRLFRSRPATSLQKESDVNPFTANPQAVDPTQDTIRNTGYVPPSVEANDLDDWMTAARDRRDAAGLPRLPPPGAGHPLGTVS